VRSKLPDTGTTIFSVMSRLAAEHDAINLSQGFPNYSSSPQLFDLVHKYMVEGYNQYALMPGEQPLREAISKKTAALYNKHVDPETEICITAGATQAIFTALQALVHPGDEVIIFDPSFDIYAPSVKLCGGKPVRLPLSYPDFRINWKEVENRVNQKTRLIIINFPNNPTGAIASREDMLALEAIVQQHGLYVISDDVYEHMVFDGKQHESILKYEGLYDRSIVTYSFGKTFHNTGWKVGYAIAPGSIMNEFRKVHQFVVFSVNRPVQLALSDYLSDTGNYMSLASFYQKKRDLFLELLKDSAFQLVPTQGTYFQLADYSAISNLNDTEFAKELTIKHGVATIPLSPFMEHADKRKLVRFCFAKTNDILEQAADKLCRI